MTTYCGVDFHARQQQVAWSQTGDGEIRAQQLSHLSPDQVREFYSKLRPPVIVGLEASGYSAWFEDLLFELGHEVRIGEAGEIGKRARSRHKNDRRDAELCLDLLLTDQFPHIYLSTVHLNELQLALDGGNSVQDRFNRYFVAAQLSLLAAPGADQGALGSQLSCYRLNFVPVKSSNGFPLSPSTLLGDLLDQIWLALSDGRTADLAEFTYTLELLNGHDPLGRCGLGGEPSFGPTVQQALDDALTQTMAQHKIPGAVVGIWVPGAGTWVVSRGVADLATGRAMQLSDHFRIASNTKTFTVTAILQLADGPEPKLRLDDTVDKYLPFVPNGDRITLRMLANMTSGLFSYAQDDSFVLSLLSNPQRVWTPRELVDIGLRHPPHFAPGQGWDYSNTNTVLLGLIIEQVTGQRVQDVLEELIFKPLGLRHRCRPHDLPLRRARGQPRLRAGVGPRGRSLHAARRPAREHLHLRRGRLGRTGPDDARGHDDLPARRGAAALRRLFPLRAADPRGGRHARRDAEGDPGRRARPGEDRDPRPWGVADQYLLTGQTMGGCARPRAAASSSSRLWSGTSRPPQWRKS